MARRSFSGKCSRLLQNVWSLGTQLLSRNTAPAAKIRKSIECLRLVLVIGVFASAWDEKHPGCGKPALNMSRQTHQCPPRRFQWSQPCGLRPNSESQVQWHKILEHPPCGEEGMTSAYNLRWPVPLNTKVPVTPRPAPDSFLPTTKPRMLSKLKSCPS